MMMLGVAVRVTVLSILVLAALLIPVAERTLLIGSDAVIVFEVLALLGPHSTTIVFIRGVWEVILATVQPVEVPPRSTSLGSKVVADISSLKVAVNSTRVLVAPIVCGSLWVVDWLIVTLSGAPKLVGTLTLAIPAGELTDNTAVAGPIVALVGMI